MLEKIVVKKEFLIRKLRENGFSERIVRVFNKVDREEFIIEKYKDSTYEDIPLPIGYNQTISQPYTIAFMLDLLEIKNGQKILEVGSGSGYVLALLAELNKNGSIFGIERIKELAENSKEKLKQYENVKVVQGDGSKGLFGEAPFDRILVSAEARRMPQKLIEQLKPRGILVTPLKNSIIKLKKIDGKNEITEHPGFIFVPLVEED